MRHIQDFEATDLNSLWRRLRTVELAVLIAVGGVVGGLWGFVELAGEVLAGSTAVVDTRLLLMLRNPHDLADPIGPPWLAVAGRDVTALGGMSILVLLVAGVTGYLLLVRRADMAFFLTISVTGGLALSVLLKALFGRPRPDLVPQLVAVSSSSFPSGHSMMSAVTYLSLGLLLASIQTNRRLRIYFIAAALVCAFLVGISRVYLGVHWPSDVLGGWTAGVIWVTLCWLGARWLRQR